MLLNGTGMGVDPESKAINVTTEWWQQKCHENLTYRKFCKSPLKWETELRIIFKDAFATGARSYCPSTQPIQTNDMDPEDVYGLSINNQEWFGDSEDDSFSQQPTPSTGVTDRMANMGVISQDGASGYGNSGSSGKRKRVVCSTKRKKQKAPPASRITDAFSIITDAMRDRAVVVGASQE